MFLPGFVTGGQQVACPGPILAALEIVPVERATDWLRDVE
jgi:hypothetical protein